MIAKYGYFSIHLSTGTSAIINGRKTQQKKEVYPKCYFLLIHDAKLMLFISREEDIVLSLVNTFRRWSTHSVVGQHFF